MHEILTHTQHKQLVLRTQFADALALKLSSRAKHKLQAQDLFREIIDSEQIDSDIRTLAMLNLCDLLLLEAKITENPDELHTLGQEQSIPPLLELPM